MGKRGPKPTPTPILDARGSWRAKTRSDAGGPLFPVEMPSCPTWLGSEAKAEWRRVARWLLDAGLIAKINRSVLTAYCVAWGRFVEAEVQVKELGEVIKSESGGLYQNPWLSIANSARTEMVKLAAEFGMTPAAASRVTPAPAEQGEEADGKGRFFKTVG